MTKIGLFGIVVLTLCTVVALAQAGGGGLLIRHQAPADRALDFPLATLQAEFADMMANKRVTTRLLEGGAYSMNARYLVGSETVQVHKSIIEIYFVRDGSATLVTGGAIEAKYGPAKAGEQQRSVCSSEKIGKALGWKPEVALKDGLRETVEWFKERTKAQAH